MKREIMQAMMERED